MKMITRAVVATLFKVAWPKLRAFIARALLAWLVPGCKRVECGCDKQSERDVVRVTIQRGERITEVTITDGGQRREKRRLQACTRKGACLQAVIRLLKEAAHG